VAGITGIGSLQEDIESAREKVVKKHDGWKEDTATILLDFKEIR
jgi:hypothetical protein